MEPLDTNAVYLLLGEVKADLKNILGKMTDQHDRLDNHSERIVALEKASHKRSVLWGAMMTVLPFIFTGLGWYITR